MEIWPRRCTILGLPILAEALGEHSLIEDKETSLSYSFIAVKRHHDQGNSYKRKHLIGDLLTVSESVSGLMSSWW